MNNMSMRVRKVIDIDIPSLGAKIKDARKADSRSLTQLAAAAGMTTANWYAIEGEEIKALPEETLRRIEEVLGTNFGARFEEKVAA